MPDRAITGKYIDQTQYKSAHPSHAPESTIRAMPSNPSVANRDANAHNRELTQFSGNTTTGSYALHDVNIQDQRASNKAALSATAGERQSSRTVETDQPVPAVKNISSVESYSSPALSSKAHALAAASKDGGETPQNQLAEVRRGTDSTSVSAANRSAHVVLPAASHQTTQIFDNRMTSSPSEKSVVDASVPRDAHNIKPTATPPELATAKDLHQPATAASRSSIRTEPMEQQFENQKAAQKADAFTLKVEQDKVARNLVKPNSEALNPNTTLAQNTAINLQKIPKPEATRVADKHDLTKVSDNREFSAASTKRDANTPSEKHDTVNSTKRDSSNQIEKHEQTKTADKLADRSPAGKEGVNPSHATMRGAEGGSQGSHSVETGSHNGGGAKSDKHADMDVRGEKHGADKTHGTDSSKDDAAQHQVRHQDSHQTSEGGAHGGGAVGSHGETGVRKHDDATTAHDDRGVAGHKDARGEHAENTSRPHSEKSDGHEGSEHNMHADAAGAHNVNNSHTQGDAVGSHGDSGVHVRGDGRQAHDTGDARSHHDGESKHVDGELRGHADSVSAHGDKGIHLHIENNDHPLVLEHTKGGAADRVLDRMIDRIERPELSLHGQRVQDRPTRRALADFILEMENGKFPYHRFKNPQAVILAAQKLGPEGMKELRTLLTGKKECMYEGIETSKKLEYRRFIETVFANLEQPRQPKTRLDALKDLLALASNRELYTVKLGQTLRWIAWNALDDAKLWPLVAKLNGFVMKVMRNGEEQPTRQPKPGARIMLPTADEVRAFRVEQGKAKTIAQAADAAMKTVASLKNAAMDATVKIATPRVEKEAQTKPMALQADVKTKPVTTEDTSRTKPVVIALAECEQQSAVRDMLAGHSFTKCPACKAVHALSSACNVEDVKTVQAIEQTPFAIALDEKPLESGVRSELFVLPPSFPQQQGRRAADRAIAI